MANTTLQDVDCDKALGYIYRINVNNTTDKLARTDMVVIPLLCEALHLGRRNFERRFKKCTGNSVMKYRRKYAGQGSGECDDHGRWDQRGA